MKSLLLVGAMLLLGACAATGLRYSEHPASLTPAPEHSARLTVYRLNNTVLYSGRSARLKLDGLEVGALAPGGFKIWNVPPGTHTLQVDMWDAPGRWELTIDVREGVSYYYQVAPRTASFVAAMPGLAVMSTTAEGALLGNAVTLGGMAVESGTKHQGGAFALIPVDASRAHLALDALRESK